MKIRMWKTLGYKPSGTVWGQVFAVPSMVVDEHIRLCSSGALKILLVMLRSPGQYTDAPALAQRLGMDKSDVLDALYYWESVGVLEQDAAPPTALEPSNAAFGRSAPSSSGDAGGGQHATLNGTRNGGYNAAQSGSQSGSQSSLQSGWQSAPQSSSQSAQTAPFNPSAPAFNNSATLLSPAPAASSEASPVPSTTLGHPTSAAVSGPRGSRARYSREEIGQLLESEKYLPELIREAQEIMGKPLTPLDVDVLAGLYSHYALTPHYIVTLLHYCVSVGKRGMAYAESVAITWTNDGVDDASVDAHADVLLRRRSKEGRVKTAIGLDRPLVTKEKQFIARWFEELHFDLDMIMIAYEKAVESTGKVAFAYTDSILSRWYQQGVKTPDQVKNEAKPTGKSPQGQEKPKNQMGELDRIFFDKMMNG